MDYKSSVKIVGLEPLAGTTRNMHSETYKIRRKKVLGMELCGPFVVLVMKLNLLETRDLTNIRVIL